MEEFKEWKFIFTILIPLTNGIIIIYNRQSFRLILQYVKKERRCIYNSALFNEASLYHYKQINFISHQRAFFYESFQG